MERLGNVWVSQLMQVQGMSEVWSGGIGKVPEFFHESEQMLDNVYTPRKQTWTPRIHIVDWKEIYCDIMWYHSLILLNLPSQHIKIDLSLDWVDGSVAGIWTHTHTGYITLSRSIKTLQNRWYIYPTTWHDRGPASNPTAHREFGLIISHKLDLSWPFNLAIPRVVGSKLPIIEINSSTQFHRVNS